MSIRSIAATSSALLISLAVLGSACDTTEDSTGDDSLRHIHFEATEVNDILAEHPDTKFLVDLREGNVVHFDQEGEDFDLSAFEAICPSMPAPIPFTDMLESLDLEVDDESAWSMRSELTETNDFRFMGGCGGGELVCNWWGLDCIFIETAC
ncbi:MAG: hypothetical protein AAF799_27480 [Myxococcota bacterium]